MQIQGSSIRACRWPQSSLWNPAPILEPATRQPSPTNPIGTLHFDWKVTIVFSNWSNRNFPDESSSWQKQHINSILSVEPTEYWICYCLIGNCILQKATSGLVDLRMFIQECSTASSIAEIGWSRIVSIKCTFSFSKALSFFFIQPQDADGKLFWS